MSAPPTKWWHVDEADGRVVCDLCPRECRLQDGQRGFCFVRENDGGEMRLTTYGRSTGFCIDPIEKKPLNHFLPGTPILSFGTAGCNLGCKFCQNWDISKSREIEILSQKASPEAICEAALKHGCRSIAFTYNDPVVWAEYAIDTAKTAREMGLKSVAVTAGYITPQARGDFYEFIDAANVDLKAFSDRFYRKLTFASIEPVLDTLKWLKRETNVWFELTNLMIPGQNDSEEEVDRMCDWILENLGDEVPVHFTAFHPDFKMRDIPATPHETLIAAWDQAQDRGLKYVYVGNVLDKPRQSTRCGNCLEPLIERDHYAMGAYRIRGGKCPDCGTAIPGVFEDERGNWGRKRLPVTIADGAGESAIAPGQRRDLAAGSAQMTPTDVKTNFEPAEVQAMLGFAREVVNGAVLNREPAAELPKELATMPGYGMFVTLRRGKLLRACIGNWGQQGTNTIGALLRHSAFATATNDPRFPSIHPRELPFLTVELSPMYDPVEMEAEGEERIKAVQVGEHGLVVTGANNRRGLLLPQVATENNWDARKFLQQVCVKAGLPQDAWLQPGTKLMTFRGRHYVQKAPQPEVEPGELEPIELQRLIPVADAVLSSTQGQFQVSPSFTQTLQSPTGLVIETLNGLQATAMRPDASVIDLLKTAAGSLVESAEKEGKPLQPVRRILLLTHGVPLQPADYPRRFGMAARCALMAQRGQQFALQIPEQNAGDAVAGILQTMNLTPAQWADAGVQMAAFQVFGIDRPAGSAGLASNASNLVETGIRPAAVAGSFYPGDAKAISAELDAYFAWETEIEPKTCRAILLPHAGWRFCGDIIAETVGKAEIPALAVVIGPKHYQEGANWSLSAAKNWQLPMANIPVAAEAADFLDSRVTMLRRDDEAHQREHGCEVLLPILHRKNPDLRIVPVAIGAADYDALEELADALRALRAETGDPLLFVISSDMNHFAPEAENRRRDELALAQLREANPRALYDVCLEHQISMCGMRPAVAVLRALLAENDGCQVEITRYETSARVTKDQSNVVGYAGALIS